MVYRVASRKPVIAHRHLALILCDSAASLAELLTQVDLTDVPNQRYGDRGIALPAPFIDDIHDVLRANGTYPRVIGEIHQPASDEDSEPEETEAS